ncbi:hypothetical protein KIPB_003216 [Kipferlia bialata]|uniref:DUF998 domain-containing protein n=1 Tax=Kipferlia bialata TaxID=797122 RepID=A0A9K3CT29_9EUKA|nr:hypothetical protein KIPB_003216 [Kipferlia bialata]|eukprot:g3216.t1
MHPMPHHRVHPVKQTVCVSSHTHDSPPGTHGQPQGHPHAEKGSSPSKTPRLLGFVLLVVLPLNVAFSGWYLLSDSTYDPIMGLARIALNISDAGSCDINPLGCRHFKYTFILGGLTAVAMVMSVAIAIGRRGRSRVPHLRTALCGLTLGVTVPLVGVFHPDRGTLVWEGMSSMRMHSIFAAITFLFLLVTNLVVRYHVSGYGRIHSRLSRLLGLITMGSLVLFIPRSLYLALGIEWAFVVASYSWLLSQILMGAIWSR